MTACFQANCVCPNACERFWKVVMTPNSLFFEIQQHWKSKWKSWLRILTNIRLFLVRKCVRFFSLCCCFFLRRLEFWDPRFFCPTPLNSFCLTNFSKCAKLLLTLHQNSIAVGMCFKNIGWFFLIQSCWRWGLCSHQLEAILCNRAKLMVIVFEKLFF